MISLNKHSIEATIVNRYASIIYSFSFLNPSKTGSNELKFELTIDSAAFISKFVANIDGIFFVGKTKEKKNAKKKYAAAKEKKENAIVIFQPYDDIPNIFCIQLTNIGSKSKIILKISIEQYLEKRLNFNQLTVQMLRNFERYNIKRKYSHIRFRLSINDESGVYDLLLPQQHLITIEQEKKNTTSCLICGEIDAQQSSLDEFSLKYRVKREESDSVLLYDDETHTFCHILSDIMSDCAINDEKDIFEGYQIDDMKHNVLIPRRIVFVVDRSAAMKGDKWKKTIAATICALKQLRNGADRYGIIYFDAQIETNPRFGLLHASAQNINESISNLQSMQASGATNINSAILTAIERIKTDITQLNEGAPNEEDILSILYHTAAKHKDKTQENKENFFMNQVIIITGSEPNAGETNTKQIISNVRRANNTRDIDPFSSKISIFCFAIGRNANDSSWIKDLNHSFLRILAANNCGFYKLIKEINAHETLNEYFDILSKPILTNIDIRYNDKYVKHLTQTRFHTLYAGNDLIICGKIDTTKNIEKELSLNVKIFAVTGTQNKTCTKPTKICKVMNVNTNNYDTNNSNLKRIWSYFKLHQFTERNMIECDEEEKKNDAFPLKIALKNKFLTPWTSMIVVKKKDKKRRKYKYTAYDEGFSESDDESYAKQKQKKKRKQAPNINALDDSHLFETSFNAFDESQETQSAAAAIDDFAGWDSMDLFGSNASNTNMNKMSSVSSNPFRDNIESANVSASNPFMTMNSNPFRDASLLRDQFSSNMNEDPFRDLTETKAKANILGKNKQESKTGSISWDPFAEITQMEEQMKRMKSGEAINAQMERSRSVEDVFIVPVAKPLEAYNKNGIKIVFRFIESNKENMCRISAEFSNHSSLEITDFTFKVAVPKYIKLQIKPATDTMLRPFVRNKVKQSFQLLNTKYGQKAYIIKIQIRYKKSGKQQVDQTTVELPQ